MSKIPLIAVVGPTASGKTALGIELCKALNGEVVSADSMQVYKGIPIASAVPTAEEKQGIPHALMEFLPLGSTFTVSDYVDSAKREISGIYSRGKQPILVGGTGLYINSLTQGITFAKQKTDYQLREKLNKRAQDIGGKALLAELALVDKETAEKLHENDIRRIVRALEIYYTSGITKHQMDEQSVPEQEPYNTTFIGITYRNRETLYSRINRRVDLMLENGLLKEAESTLFLPAGNGAMQAIGHKELHCFLRGEVSLEQAVENIKMETRRYAKRQLTWFRKNTNINWIYADETENVLDCALNILKGGNKNG